MVKLDNFATFDALLTKVMPEIDLIQEYKPVISIKMGFPPKPVPMELDTLLRDVGFDTRTKVIIEVNQEMLQKMMEETLKSDESKLVEEKKQMQGTNKGCDAKIATKMTKV